MFLVSYLRDIWGKKSSSTPDFLQTNAFWGFASAYVSKCRNITRCHRNMVDSALKSWWSILSDPNKIFVIRTHPEELHVLKCIRSSRISTIFSQQWGQQMKPIISKGDSKAFFWFFHQIFFLAFNSRDMTILWVLNLFSRSSSTKLWKRIF